MKPIPYNIILKTILQVQILVVLLLISSPSYSQIYSDTTWERWYGKQNCNEGMASITNHIEHYDKGFVFHGRSFQSDLNKPMIKKTDINGYFLWERKLDSLSNNYIGSIKTTADGGIVLCGGINGATGVSNPWVAKLNVCMEVEWCKTFQWSAYSYANGMAIDHEGNIIVLTNYYGQSPSERIGLIKLNAEGEVLWKNSYATMSDYPYIWNAFGNKVFISADNNYYISGNAEWPTNNDPQQGKGDRPFIVKVNSNGDEEWVLPFGIYDGVFGKSFEIVEEQENIFLATGLNSDNSNPLLFYFDDKGEVVSYANEILFPDTHVINWFLSTKKIGDNRFYSILRYMNDWQQQFPLNSYLIHDSLLNVVDYFDAPEVWFPASLVQTFNNKILTVAKTLEENNEYSYDIYLNKRNTDFTFDTVYTNWAGSYDSLCPDGIVSGYLPYICDDVVGIEDIPSPEQYAAQKDRIEIIIQPNPAHDKAMVKLEKAEDLSDIEWSLYNQTGEVLMVEKLANGQLEVQIDISGMVSGIYFLILRSEGKFVGSSKLVVE